MAELESVIEKKLIDQLCSGESQWTYRQDIRTEEDLWNNFKYILEQNNKAKLDDIPLSESEFAKVKNDVSHASFYDAGKWLVGENGKVYNYKDGELANGNKLKELADYAGYKANTPDALSKLKFNIMLIREFKENLMPEISPLIV